MILVNKFFIVDDSLIVYKYISINNNGIIIILKILKKILSYTKYDADKRTIGIVNNNPLLFLIILFFLKTYIINNKSGILNRITFKPSLLPKNNIELYIHIIKIYKIKFSILFLLFII